jgi:hypothetical protein
MLLGKGEDKEDKAVKEDGKRGGMKRACQEENKRNRG